jgi:hypothetical protein
MFLSIGPKATDGIRASQRHQLSDQLRSPQFLYCVIPFSAYARLFSHTATARTFFA